MRATTYQRDLTPISIDHDHSRDLDEISRILDRSPEIMVLVQHDLLGGKSPDVGRPGMTAEQVARAKILKTVHGLSFAQLEFHLLDSQSARRFTRLFWGQNPKCSTLAENIGKLTPETWESISRVVLGVAREEGVERGQKMRGDCTVTETNVHRPTDSSLLWDCVRVLSRSMDEALYDFPGRGLSFVNHTRRAKRRSFGAAMAARSRKWKPMRKAYKDLLKVTRKTVGYARTMARQLRALGLAGLIDPQAGDELADWLDYTASEAKRVIAQTERRVFAREKVPAAEKVTSIFDPYTAIIIKGGHGPEFGRKLCLSTGPSSMVLDCMVLDGNPNDSTLVKPLLERHYEIYGRYPRQIAFDGAFASRANVAFAKSLGVKDVMFHKRCGLKETDMARSAAVFKSLRRFRAGIEGCISTLKRGFGLDRCPRRGDKRFKAHVWSAIVAYNLLVLARHLRAKREKQQEQETKTDLAA